VVFSPNIYFEIINSNSVNSWYEKINGINQEGLHVVDFLKEMNDIGYRIINFEERDGKGYSITITPPYDQGLLSMIRNRFFFDYAVSVDKNGIVQGHGLKK
jgi:hypothetical protein